MSHIGRKQISAVTGLAWTAFVLTHMLGNLLIFVGPEAYNKYSHTLISNPFILIAELGLLLTIILHVFEGLILAWENHRARPSKYQMPTNGKKAARPNSKWMAYHGSLILVFLILHIITFKYGPAETEGYVMNVDGVVMRDLYRLVIEVFHSPIYVVWYAVCMVAVGLHLSHGFYSSFCTLGLYHPRYSPWLNKFGYIYAFIVAAGFFAQPIYVYFVKA